MKTLIISDYDCCTNYSTVLYENRKITNLDLAIGYDAISELSSYLYNNGKFEEPYDESNRVAQDYVRDLIRSYDDIILCQDGGCDNILSKSK